MTLQSLLSVLESNLNLMLTVIDGSPVITFDAAGAGAISSELGAREIDRIGVESAMHFHIYLKPLPEEPNEPEPEPNEGG